MITPYYQERGTIRHEFRIPSPAIQRDLEDTIWHAVEKWRSVNNYPRDKRPADDNIKIESSDDELCVYFIEEKVN